MVQNFVQRVGSLTRLATDIQEPLRGYVSVEGLSLDVKCFTVDSFLTSIYILYSLNTSIVANFL